MKRLAPNVLASVLTPLVLIATALISVPVILGEVGVAGFGAWTLAQTLLVYVTTAEAGLGPAVQRFVAVARGAGTDEPVRFLWSSILLYAAIGLALGTLLQPLAPLVADVLGARGDLREDALDLYRLVGAAIALALLASALGNVQQGLERFGSYALSALAGSVVFLAGVIWTLGAGWGLPGLGAAAVAQQLVMLAVRAAAMRDLLGRRPALASRRECREVLGFAARLQVTVLSLLVNTQTDKLIVGVVATPATLGQLGIGSQIAESGRLVGGAALSPVISRLSITHGQEDAGGLHRLFAALNRIWMLVVVGGVVIATAALEPLIRAWLGRGHGEAALLGAPLVVAYGLSLLTGPAVAYLRAVGRPSLEARYGVVLVAANVLLTVALGVAFGALGVVAATAAAYVAGTVWFFRRLRGAAPELAHLRMLPAAREVALAVVAAAAAAGFGVAVNEVVPAGLALLPVAGGAAVAFALFLSRVTGVAPTPRAVREALAHT